MKPIEIIIAGMREHRCTTESCGHGIKPNHQHTMEIDSDVFIEATQATATREGGLPIAPD